MNSHKSHRPTVVRLQKICAALSDGKHVTGRALADMLEVNPKTVDRDINYMRDQMGLPIATDGSKMQWYGGGGYHFTKPVILCRCCGGKI
ncbi:MAG TPA: HTH domain-containing protein [Candidatus Sulfotelmatobacter sp.]|jgi:predicted DNA-binding transcriptional regulator YafY|nr:HTH domain-containing protein [Candidatus Sulfotelmatobacter sp.]